MSPKSSEPASKTEEKIRSFTTILTVHCRPGGDQVGNNVQLVECVIKIVDTDTREPIRFDPNSVMVHPSGGRIQLSGIISQDGTGAGMPEQVPSLAS